jgi:hypothetical protein
MAHHGALAGGVAGWTGFLMTGFGDPATLDAGKGKSILGRRNFDIAWKAPLGSEQVVRPPCLADQNVHRSRD